MTSASHVDPVAVGPHGRRAPSSPRVRARLAALLYFLAVAVAVSSEFLVPGKLGIIGIFLPVASSMAATVLLYSVFRPVNPALATIAALCNLAGLALETVELHPYGFNLAMVLHGVYTILLGWLMWNSRYLPRVFGALMALAGLIWLINLAPSLERAVPWNTAVGLLSETAPMLWLLAVGIRSATRQTHSEEAQQ